MRVQAKRQPPTATMPLPPSERVPAQANACYALRPTRTKDSDVTVSMDDLMALCKRRGFIFPASEIYGGINGFWDYGPLGVELKNNLRDAWWNDMVRCPPLGPDGQPVDIVGVDTAIIQNPKIWEA